MATAIRRTRSRARRRRTMARLRRLHWGWKVTGLLVAAAAIRAWTAQIITALAVTAAIVLFVAAVHGRRYLQSRTQRSRPTRRVRWIPRPRAPRPADLNGYLALDATAFEHAIARLVMRDPNAHSAIPQGGPNDRGLDVLVRLRDGRRILIQCKRYGPRKNVSSEDVQKTNGTYRDIHDCDIAVIVTTSSFTRDAAQTNCLLARPLLLVDGPALTAWTAGGPPPWHTVPAAR